MEVICYKCKEPDHYKNECSKLNKKKPKKKVFKEKNKVLVATCDDSESSKDDFEDEQVSMTLMASTKASRSNRKKFKHLRGNFSFKSF